ncbi:MAG: hypothetical protein KUG77_23805, partial [Nannocystaceae bacterium]|nr:hypothetical protein [Nannocystaceae bacterium]
MRKVARRLAGLVVIVGVGCSFETGSSSDSNQLGSSNDTDATATTGGDTGGSTGNDAAGSEGSTGFIAGSTSVANDEACVDSCAPTVPGGWNGPFYVVEAANPIDCPAGFT